VSDETLPPGWALTSIDQVATNYSGNSKLIKGKLSEQPGDGLFPAFSASGQDVWCNVAEEEGQAIIVSAVGARCGKAFRATGKWSAIANTHVVRINPDAGDFDFFFWLLNREHYWVKGGTAQPFVRVRATFERPFWLPPLAEQKRIVAKIEELFSELEAGEESLRVARRQLGVYRQSLLKQAFEGKLTEKWRTQNPAKLESPAQLLARVQADRETRYTHRLNQWKASIAATGSKPMKPRTADIVSLAPEAIEGLPQLPTPWIWTSLSQLADHITDGTHKTPKYVEEGVEFISAKDIDDFHISAGTKCITAEEHEELCRRCKPVAGDILLTKSGTIGRTAVVPAGRDFSVFESVAVVPISRLVNADFFALQIFRTASGAFGATAQKGVAVRHLHLEDIRRLPTALPSLPEQQEIVRLLDELFEVIERNERELDAALQRSEALRQAILKKAFTGRLVPQSPADEPASALLARLRQKVVAYPEQTNKRLEMVAESPARPMRLRRARKTEYR